ncbi:MAG: TauD/TfdA family dioxygenase [Ectothiorhodospiraceae bacterium]|nr:TauD/TfdA family dioxygenase [Ectothiorhodospiraceae bacterium]
MTRASSLASTGDWRRAAAARGIGVEDLSRHTGSRLTGIDLAGPLDDDMVGLLEVAVAERVVLVFPEHGHLTPAGLVGFADRFDGVFNLHTRRDLCLPAHHEIFLVGNVDGGSPKVGLNWHSDDYHLAHPGLYTFLHAIIVPPRGGDTTYANGIAAFEALAPELRERLGDIRVRHSRRRLFRELFPDATEDAVEAEGRKFPDVVHPLVRVHPVSGRRGLYLGGEWGSAIESDEPDEAAALYARLLRHLIDGEYTYTHRWCRGDLLFSDNRCSLHRASEWDTDTDRRLLHRIILWDTEPPR